MRLNYIKYFYLVVRLLGRSEGPFVLLGFVASIPALYFHVVYALSLSNYISFYFLFYSQQIIRSLFRCFIPGAVFDDE